MKKMKCLALFLFACVTGLVHADSELDVVKKTGFLKVAVYQDFYPFSQNNVGIDIDLAKALAKKLGVQLTLLPFPAGDNLSDDLRNMVWKGHYLGYGPAQVMLHVPVDPILENQNGQVKIFSKYYQDSVRLLRNTQKIPSFTGLDSLTDKTIGVEGDTIGAELMIGAENGKFRDRIKIFANANLAFEKLKSGEIDAVVTSRAEAEALAKDQSGYATDEINFPRYDSRGWAVGMAVKKDQPELTAALQTALNEMKTSGELAAIFNAYGVKPNW